MPKILVVDDDEKIREVLELFLKSKGFDVISASNGKVAVALLRRLQRLPDLVLMDVMMPELDGYSAVKIIREEITKSVPIIFLTVRDSSNDLVAGFDAGANEFMTKPFDYEKLESTIKRVLDSPNNHKRITRY